MPAAEPIKCSSLHRAAAVDPRKNPKQYVVVCLKQSSTTAHWAESFKWPEKVHFHEAKMLILEAKVWKNSHIFWENSPFLALCAHCLLHATFLSAAFKPGSHGLKQCCIRLFWTHIKTPWHGSARLLLVTKQSLLREKSSRINFSQSSAAAWEELLP